MFKKLKIALGIISGKVFTGPLEVAVDITNRCGLGCITCWFYSPLNKARVSEEWSGQTMDFELFKRIADELKGLEVRKMMVGADGDPFTHPRIMEMLEYAKKSGFTVNTSTCGVYFNDENLQRLFNSGLDGLNISVLAATPRTYLNMHPGQKEKLFEKVRRSLILLSRWKQRHKKKTPFVRLINVICNLNYFEADRMIDFAKEVKADAVDFKRLAVTPFTKTLLLNVYQVRELEEKLQAALKTARASGLSNNIEQFRKGALPGLVDGNYSAKLYSRIPCYIGWLYARILCDGSVVPCCGCWNYRIGNVNLRSFKEIWLSKEYAAFRKKSLGINRDAAITKECACHSCAHIGMNMGIYRRLHFLK